jgi:hypothetical protein
VPAVHGNLAGDQRGTTAIAVLGQFQQVALLLRAERLDFQSSRVRGSAS